MTSFYLLDVNDDIKWIWLKTDSVIIDVASI